MATSTPDIPEGAPVEVRKVWASRGATQPPLRSWFKGYTFVRYEGGATAIVEDARGMRTRWPREDVRLAA